MDGFHLTRKQLDDMPDPQLAHKRRGAEWTFDPAGLGSVLSRAATESGIVYAPSFDHARKDPVECDIAVQPHHKLVISEGNYLLLSKSPWRETVTPLFDKRWALLTDPEVARQRCVKRHVEAGIAASPAAADARWQSNDWPNGRQLLQEMDTSVLGLEITESLYVS
eukprot:g73152.t1